jgi:hypothetical protein
MQYRPAAPLCIVATEEGGAGTRRVYSVRCNKSALLSLGGTHAGHGASLFIALILG